MTGSAALSTWNSSRHPEASAKAYEKKRRGVIWTLVAVAIFQAILFATTGEAMAIVWLTAYTFWNLGGQRDMRRRLKRLRVQAKELSRRHKEVFVTWIGIIQNGILTGSDIGLVWVEDGMLIFDGQDGRFELTPDMVNTPSRDSRSLTLKGMSRDVTVQFSPYDRYGIDRVSLLGIDVSFKEWLSEAAPTRQGSYPSLEIQPALRAHPQYVRDASWMLVATVIFTIAWAWAGYRASTTEWIANDAYRNLIFPMILLVGLPFVIHEQRTKLVRQSVIDRDPTKRLAP